MNLMMAAADSGDRRPSNPREETVKSLVLLSGGMDSTVLAGHLLGAGIRSALSRSTTASATRRTDRSAADVAGHYGIEHARRGPVRAGRLLSGSALTDPSVDVPLGHYADASMRATVVPNRNAIMLMAAVGVAAARGYGQVATAVHAGDHPIYPDCRPEFIAAADLVARYATAGYGDVGVVAPFVTRSTRRGSPAGRGFGRAGGSHLVVLPGRGPALWTVRDMRRADRGVPPGRCPDPTVRRNRQ
jgi:7-cyano-7-deazaguanine synthase